MMNDEYHDGAVFHSSFITPHSSFFSVSRCLGGSISCPTLISFDLDAHQLLLFSFGGFVDLA
ncbi:MAG: hypothetical protein M3371_10670, partial [Acidobacteriota bacterium]|nr:hypothetical protein [Acidobacteriota bacterium]